MKEFDPVDDGGAVAFTVNGTENDNGGSGFGHGEGTEFENVPLDDNTVSEAGFGETDLADYDSEWSCSDDRSGQGTSIPAFDLDYGDMVTCTFTNHRKPQLNVKKVFNPTTDAGKVDFTVNGAQNTNGGDGFGHNGETGFQNVPLADNAVSEAGHGETDLAPLRQHLRLPER